MKYFEMSIIQPLPYNEGREVGGEKLVANDSKGCMIDILIYHQILKGPCTRFEVEHMSYS